MQPIDTVVFDLDDTLYPRHTGLMAAVGARMQAFMLKVTGLDASAADSLRAQYLQTYGTTLAGLEANYAIDSEAFLHDVHNVEHRQFIDYDAALDRMLGQIEQRKLIFTNGTIEHATDVLNVLGVRHHFDAILDLRSFGMRPKPNAAAYERLFATLDHAPDKALYIDDRPGNLVPAAEAGVITVLMNETKAPVNTVARHQISHILELESLL